jgi:hypothetical protein
MVSWFWLISSSETGWKSLNWNVHWPIMN